MPCYYTGSREGDALLASRETEEKLAAKVTKLTALLCEQCREIEKINKMLFTPRVQAWWTKHKRLDKKRGG